MADLCGINIVVVTVF